MEFTIQVMMWRAWKWSSALGQSWWRHQKETFSALLALCEGNSPVTGEFPSQNTVMRILDAFLDMYLNTRLNKPTRGRWFVAPLRSLWRHCNGWLWNRGHISFAVHMASYWFEQQIKFNFEKDDYFFREISRHLDVYWWGFSHKAWL